ncbi:MAG: cobalamin biosynthesis protein CbiD, partial [Desulfobacula sp.]|nr:cobalamin biosynthesis protein CbiD [Desulfobacula sp.]
MSSKTKVLKKGFTTGAAAAAAVKAALMALFADQPEDVEITFLTGEKKNINIYSLEKTADQSCNAIVIKDAGDDPDITHKAKIGAKITLSHSDKTKINIAGGKGVGTITKPGLELPVGEPAINPGPRRMIQNSVKEVFEKFNIKNRLVDIEIFVPRGELLAKKTLNARLGILGGISILGTTGIVTPMSHDAYIATIKSSIFVAAAKKLNTLVFTTGRRSERFAMLKFKEMKEEAFIQTG